MPQTSKLASSRRSCWCTAPSPMRPAGTASSSGCSSRAIPLSPRPTRCAAWPPIRPTPPACSTRSTARYCSSGIPTLARSSPTPRPAPPNVVGLVYIAAFATEEGENLNDVESGSKDSILGAALVQYQYPAGPDGETAVELAVNPALFREAFAADLPPETTALLAATQRPIAVTAFSEASGPPAWKKLPSWTVVATGDKAAGADVIRSEAQRAGAHITEVEGSHVIMISQPQAVTDVIVTAAKAVAGSHR